MEDGRNPCRLGTDVVTPAGVTIFLEGVGYLFPSPQRTGGNSRTHTGGNPRYCPGSSVVIVAPFLEVLFGTRHFGVLGAWWNFSGGRSGCESSLFSSNLRCRLYFLFVVLLCFLLGMIVLFVPAVTLQLYRLVAILI